MSFPPATWCDVDTGDVRWCVTPLLRDALLGPAGLRLDEWLQSGQASVVKQGPHRVVYRVELGRDVVYIKHNLLPDARAWLRQLVRPSKARMEYDRAVAMAARGVPTVEPLAIGERRAALGAGDSYLVTRSLDDTQTLNSFLALTVVPMPPRRRARVRQGLARALGRLLARLHDAGVRHDDFHAANILVRLDAHDEPDLFLIDPSAVHVLRGPLDWPASFNNLVTFTRWFVPRVSRADRLRFWRAYFEARGLGTWPDSIRGPREHFVLARALEQRAFTSTLEFWRRRDPRCLASNRYFRRLRAPGVVGHAVTDLDRAAVARLLADPDAPFRAPGVRLLKDSPSSTVAELELPTATGTCRVIYKRFRVTRWSDPWTALVRRAPALRSWQLGHAFRDRCLPTARPLLVLHRVRHGLKREGYLLTEKIEDALDLHGFLAQLAELPPPERRAQRQWCIDAVARVVRQLHRCRLSHRDLKAANLLLTGRIGDDISPYRPLPPSSPRMPLSSLLPLPASRVWLIDLVGVRQHTRLSRSRRVQNLARLNASFCQSHALTRTDRLRFLRAYLLWNLHGRGAWKRWWRAIAVATDKKAARNARSGRILA
jgi:tRNA A-37 threonylcarbamoyl transferase component Bud32